MQSFDVGAIVPSTRDLLQAIATRRKGMALVALVGSDRPAASAARLDALNVSALALAEPGAAMLEAARATKTVPMLCLAPAHDRDACLAARYYGADGVCVEASQPLEDWDRLAKTVRTMRMLPIAHVRDAASAETALKAGARAVLLQAASVDELLALAKPLPRTVTIVAEIAGATVDVLRRLVGEVDAAIVPPAVHDSPEFASFVGEVDP